MKKKYEFPSCSSTAGKPFEENPKCPLFIKCNEYLGSNGWERVFYNSSKTATGDLCSSKYKRMEKEEDIISMLEIIIEGTKSSCTMNTLVTTYHPNNIMNSLDHECEGEIIKCLDSLFEGHALVK